MSEPQDQGRAPSADTTSSLPPEAITFATRMYDAARQGNTDLLQQAIDAGLPPNLTNGKGDTLVRFSREVSLASPEVVFCGGALPKRDRRRHTDNPHSLCSPRTMATVTSCAFSYNAEQTQIDSMIDSRVH